MVQMVIVCSSIGDCVFTLRKVSVGGGGFGNLKEQDIHLDQIRGCLSLLNIKDLWCLY